MDLDIEGGIAVPVCFELGSLATALVKAGCIVAINGRNAVTLDQTARGISDETGTKIIPVIGDVAAEGSVEPYSPLPRNRRYSPSIRQIERAIRCLTIRRRPLNFCQL
jgi:hypothetical protein